MFLNITELIYLSWAFWNRTQKDQFKQVTVTGNPRPAPPFDLDGILFDMLQGKSFTAACGWGPSGAANGEEARRDQYLHSALLLIPKESF